MGKMGWGLAVTVLASAVALGAKVSKPEANPSEGLLPLRSAALPPAPVPVRVTVAAVGDVLLHSPLQRQAVARPEGFQSLWKEAQPWLEGADIAYANLEGPTASGLTRSGRTQTDPGFVFDNQVYTSYPLFNYHPRLVSDLKASGIDVVSTANNHALDRGAKGTDATIAALEQAGLPFVGTRRSDGSGSWSVRTEVKGMTLGWVACSFSTNGVPDPKHQVLDCYRDKAVVLDEIRGLAQDPSVAAVIVTPHWGVEYTAHPQPQEKRLAQDLVDAGARVVLGAHPHVPQPWETLYGPDGKPALVVYSLGNFVSGQFHRLHTRASLLVNVEFEALPGQKASLVSAHYVPLEMRRTGQGLAVEPVLDGRGTPAISQHLRQLFGPWEEGLKWTAVSP